MIIQMKMIEDQLIINLAKVLVGHLRTSFND